MLSPDNAATPWILAVVIVGVIALMIVRAARKDRLEYQRFKRMRITKRRQAMFRRWVLQSLAVFGGSAVVLLALAWQFIPLLLADIDDWGWIAAARMSGLVPGLLIGILLAVFGGAVLGILLARKETEIPTLGDVQALLPRNRAELRWGAALSINAGVVEELLFRLALPAAIYGVTGSSVVAVVASLVIFALLHVYQGVGGIIGSLVIGTILFTIYIASGSILLVIVVHALFDLRSLVLIPIVLFKVHLVTSGNGVAVRAPATATAAAATPAPTAPGLLGASAAPTLPAAPAPAPAAAPGLLGASAAPTFPAAPAAPAAQSPPAPPAGAASEE